MKRCLWMVGFLSVCAFGGALQERIDAASAVGGGVVQVGPGVHVSPALQLRSGVTLRLEAGSRLPPDPFPEIPEKGLYVGMWLGVLPAYGFYLRHADDIVFENVTVRPDGTDVRPLFRADDCLRVSGTCEKVE